LLGGSESLEGAEASESSEYLLEDTSNSADVAEDRVEVCAAENILSIVAFIDPGSSELVVLVPLLVVGENGVCFGDFFEAFRRFRRLVPIWVVLYFAFSIVGFCLVLTGSFLD